MTWRMSSMNLRAGRFLYVEFVLLLVVGLSASGQEKAAVRKRPVTVADAIGMTRLAADDTSLIPSPPARFSPGGKQFILVLKKGDLEKNTNEFSLLRFRTSEAFRSPRP